MQMIPRIATPQEDDGYKNISPYIEAVAPAESPEGKEALASDVNNFGRVLICFSSAAFCSLCIRLFVEEGYNIHDAGRSRWNNGFNVAVGMTPIDQEQI